jgi:hypothetical protein
MQRPAGGVVARGDGRDARRRQAEDEERGDSNTARSKATSEGSQGWAGWHVSEPERSDTQAAAHSA